MKIVVDTNILFSGILNSSSKIGQLLLGSKGYFQFYTCNFLLIELIKHKKKLLALTQLPEEELFELQTLLSQNITFINELLIPSEIVKSTELLLQDIDSKDTPFVALAIHLKALIWTGDLKLINGLKRKNFTGFVSTQEILILLNNLQQE